MLPDHPYWLATSTQGELLNLLDTVAFPICEKTNKHTLYQYLICHTIPLRAVSSSHFVSGLKLSCMLSMFFLSFSPSSETLILPLLHSETSFPRILVELAGSTHQQRLLDTALHNLYAMVAQQKVTPQPNNSNL